ncbi:cold-shock protein [Pseudomonas sp. MAFF 730085]|uniref:Cold-shock protein n=1 Tax=Pseudomonas kitaguniensis TaxID=2607908 RepID=A0A5N7JY05_9PSED|nr:cold-shock protein [Pseudomonas kitaguniensis]
MHKNFRSEGMVELFAGDSVSFDVIKDGKGPRAVNIIKV